MLSVARVGASCPDSFGKTFLGQAFSASTHRVRKMARDVVRRGNKAELDSLGPKSLRLRIPGSETKALPCEAEALGIGFERVWPLLRKIEMAVAPRDIHRRRAIPFDISRRHSST